jgi:hypothetical protein
MYKKLICILFSLLLCQQIHPRIGCMDNSEKLQKKGDSKSYHYVACTCPCERYRQLSDRNKCTKCNHFHDAVPYVIISTKNSNQS